MRNFKRIKRGIEVAPLLEEVMANGELWDRDTTRQRLDAHREARAILLHSQAEPADADKVVRETFPSCFTYVGRRTSVAGHFPLTCETVEGFARSVAGLLGRVALVNLEPNGRVYPHIDTGYYYRVRSRYHLILQSAAGSRLNAGNEGVTMHEGELWWFNNRIPHEAYNSSDQDRIHVIFDLISPASVGSAAYRFSRNRAVDLYRSLRRRVA